METFTVAVNLLMRKTKSNRSWFINFSAKFHSLHNATSSHDFVTNLGRQLTPRSGHQLVGLFCFLSHALSAILTAGLIAKVKLQLVATMRLAHIADIPSGTDSDNTFFMSEEKIGFQRRANSRERKLKSRARDGKLFQMKSYSTVDCWRVNIVEWLWRWEKSRVVTKLTRWIKLNRR